MAHPLRRCLCLLTILQLLLDGDFACSSLNAFNLSDFHRMFASSVCDISVGGVAFSK